MWATNENIIGFFVSFVANFLSALAGGGSGLFLLPALLFLGIPFPVALASHKIATVGLGVGASFRHSFVKAIDKFFILKLSIAGIPGVIIGAMMATHIPEDIAKLALGALILSITVINLFSLHPKESGAQADVTDRNCFIGWLGIFIIGVLNGSLTSGTGLLFSMWLVAWFKQPFLLALSYTMIVCSFLYNTTGAIILGTSVSVNFTFVVILVIGAIIGGFIGASLSLYKGEEFVKKAFSLSCALIGTVLIYQSVERML